MTDYLKKMKTFEEGFDLIVKDLKDLIIRKQKDYGHGNILKFGQLGVMVRVSDKFERLINLWKKGTTPKNETVIDTWQDIANYAIIWLMLEKKVFDLPLKDDR